MQTLSELNSDLTLTSEDQWIGQPLAQLVPDILNCIDMEYFPEVMSTFESPSDGRHMSEQYFRSLARNHWRAGREPGPRPALQQADAQRHDRSSHQLPRKSLSRVLQCDPRARGTGKPDERHRLPDRPVAGSPPSRRSPFSKSSAGSSRASPTKTKTSSSRSCRFSPRSEKCCSTARKPKT